MTWLLVAGAGLPGAVRAASCTPSDDILCLNDGRFRVEATWRTPDGEQGRGHTVQLTSDTGTFWFFDPANLELVVKVLDACAPPYGHFWVFAGGLTDVDVRLTVTDTASGTTRTYDNPMGRQFQPINDTDAFATCGVVRAASADPLPQLVVAELPQWQPGEAVPAAAPAVVTTSAPAAAITAAAANGGAAPSELWLGRWGRFVVTVDWDDARHQGRAGAVQLSPDSGYFFFFDPRNVEVAVKVLDACDSHDTFWVFASGLTNLGVRLTVRDDLTEEVKVYTSDVNEPFQPIVDTEGLQVCP